MKHVLLWLLMLPMFAAAQTKTKKPTTTLDVDKLCSKYYDGQTITIHTTTGDITADVKISYNDAGKPYSIILYGWLTLNNQTLNKVMRDLIAAKEKAGYKYVNYDVLFFDTELVSTDVYQKQTQYAKYGISTMEDRNRAAWQGAEYNERLKPKKYAAADFFYFEVGDLRRKNTGKQENFTF